MCVFVIVSKSSATREIEKVLSAEFAWSEKIIICTDKKDCARWTHFKTWEAQTVADVKIEAYH